MTKSKKILIVEDDADNRLALCTIVESLNFEFIECASGQEALTAIKGESFDLAFIDIMMPVVNGYDVLHEIRENTRLGKTPVIMITAKDQGEEIIEGYQHGADYYITKPYTSKQIEYGIELLLSPKESKKSL